MLFYSITNQFMSIIWERVSYGLERTTKYCISNFKNKTKGYLLDLTVCKKQKRKLLLHFMSLNGNSVHQVFQL